MHIFQKLYKILIAFILSVSVGLALSGCGGSTAASGSTGGAAAKGDNGKSSTLTVRMLDIGQGDSFLLEKDGKFVMIDTGDIEHREAIVQLLKKYHVKTISKIIITHPHADHLGGMNAIFKNFKVESIYDDGMPANTASYKNYLKQIEANKIPYQSLKAGDEVNFFDGVNFKVLGPVKKIKDQKGNSDFNNNSIVGRLTYGNFSMMLLAMRKKKRKHPFCRRRERLRAMY